MLKISEELSFLMEEDLFEESLSKDLIEKALDQVFEDYTTGYYNYFSLVADNKSLYATFVHGSWHVEYYKRPEPYKGIVIILEKNILDDNEVLRLFYLFYEKKDLLDLSGFMPRLEPV